jgi:hypothetical protein
MHAATVYPWLILSPFMCSSSKKNKGKGRASVPPTEWTVEDVVNWLQSEDFDGDICQKFMRMSSRCLLDTNCIVCRTDHRVAGKDLPTLLEKDVLKSEIGIDAWGERQQILRAINALGLEGE